MHIEHIIIGLLTDSDIENRRTGSNLLMEARRQELQGVNNEPMGIRTFEKLQPDQVNWGATSYVDFVDIGSLPKIFEPSITKDLSQQQVIFIQSCFSGLLF